MIVDGVHIIFFSVACQDALVGGTVPAGMVGLAIVPPRAEVCGPSAFGRAELIDGITWATEEVLPFPLLYLMAIWSVANAPWAIAESPFVVLTKLQHLLGRSSAPGGAPGTHGG